MRITAIGQGNAALPARVYDQVDELGDDLARQIFRGVEQARQLDRMYLLGCPGGRSGRPVYRAMGRRVHQHDLDVSHLIIVMMDNYVRRVDGSYQHCPDGAHYSCRRFALEEIRDVINGPARTADKQLPQVWLPDPADPQDYHRRIVAAGGIDMFILASGASDGHVAFNPPGSPIESACRVVELSHETRRDNMQTFPQFRTMSDVPTHGVTVGIATLTGLSRAAALVIHGEHKRPSVRRLHACGSYDPAWPVSCVFDCLNSQVYLDRTATGEELAS